MHEERAQRLEETQELKAAKLYAEQQATAHDATQQKLVAEKELALDSAALTLQCSVRCWHARIIAQQRRGARSRSLAATRIQSASRRRIAQAVVSRKRAEREARLARAREQAHRKADKKQQQLRTAQKRKAARSQAKREKAFAAKAKEAPVCTSLPPRRYPKAMRLRSAQRAAAITIQCAVRCRSARKKVEQTREQRSQNLTSVNFQPALVVMNTRFEEETVRRQLKEAAEQRLCFAQDSAAIQLQCAIRRRAARVCADTKRQEKRLQEIGRKQGMAAAKIQSAHRMSRVRRKQIESKKQAELAARVKTLRERKRRVEEERLRRKQVHKAAVKVQSAYRQRLARGCPK